MVCLVFRAMEFIQVFLLEVANGEKRLDIAAGGYVYMYQCSSNIAHYLLVYAIHTQLT